MSNKISLTDQITSSINKFVHTLPCFLLQSHLNLLPIRYLTVRCKLNGYYTTVFSKCFRLHGSLASTSIIARVQFISALVKANKSTEVVTDSLCNSLTLLFANNAFVLYSHCTLIQQGKTDPQSNCCRCIHEVKTQFTFLFLVS